MTKCVIYSLGVQLITCVVYSLWVQLEKVRHLQLEKMRHLQLEKVRHLQPMGAGCFLMRWILPSRINCVHYVCYVD